MCVKMTKAIHHGLLKICRCSHCHSGIEAPLLATAEQLVVQNQCEYDGIRQAGNNDIEDASTKSFK